MKATLEFDFDKEGSDDRHEHARMLKATDLCGCLFDMDQYLRNSLKYDANPPSLEDAREKLHEIMRDHGVILDDLYS